jgi:biopolymer transport protein ExbD
MRLSPSLQPINTINLTSLMDVTFNLLIAFMIIAPTLKHGMKLDLPEVSASNLKPKKSLMVVIRKAPEAGEEERIYLNDRRVSIEELTENLSAVYEKKADQDVLIEADRTIPYELVAQVLNAIQKSGVESVGLVTEPHRRK